MLEFRRERDLYKPILLAMSQALSSLKNQESAKGAGGKGARVINCHNFFLHPRQGNKENRPTQQRKARQNEKCDNLRPRPPLRRPPFGPSEKTSVLQGVLKRVLGRNCARRGESIGASALELLGLGGSPAQQRLLLKRITMACCAVLIVALPLRRLGRRH